MKLNKILFSVLVIVLFFVIDSMLGVVLHPLIKITRDATEIAYISFIYLHLFTILAVIVVALIAGFFFSLHYTTVGVLAACYVIFSWLYLMLISNTGKKLLLNRSFEYVCVLFICVSLSMLIVKFIDNRKLKQR